MSNRVGSRRADTSRAASGSAVSWGPADEFGGQLGNARRAAEGHVALHARVQVVDDPIHTLFPSRGQPVQVWPSDHARRRSESQRLDDVAASPDAAVAHDVEIAANGFGRRLNQIDDGGGPVELAAAVIGQHDAVKAPVAGDHRVGHTLDTLDQHRTIP